jgi:hypothetical protein
MSAVKSAEPEMDDADRERSPFVVRATDPTRQTLDRRRTEPASVATAERAAQVSIRSPVCLSNR